MQSRDSFAQWQKLGVRRADGKPFPQDGNGILFFPSGANGPAFIVTDNFAVLKEYNNSDAYAIAVGHLADRMHGGPPIKAKWPADDHPLSRDARIALQKKLSALGYKVNDFEGHIDFDLRDNIRAEQNKLGMVPDGNPTAAFLAELGVQGPLINAPPFGLRMAADVFGFEANHFEKIAEGLQAAAARHGGKVARQARHILATTVRSPGSRRCGWVGHAGPVAKQESGAAAPICATHENTPSASHRKLFN